MDLTEDGPSTAPEFESWVGDFTDAGFFAWMSVFKAEILVAGALDRDLKERVGVPLNWCEVLSRLSAAPGARMRMQELADEVLLSKSGVSQLVTAMARKGLVERQGDPANLRVTYAALTPVGRTTLEKSAPVFLGGIRELFSRHLTDSEIRTVTRAMNKVISATGREPENPDRPRPL
jgi:DNA-binding MarR family transcriptional regulator